MSRGLAGLISVLGAAGGAMSGYAKGRDQFDERQRRKVQEGRDDAEYEYQQGQRAKSQKLEGDVTDAMADRAVETVAQPDMSGADISMAGPQPTQYKVGDQTYADEGQARAALQGTNSRAAKYQRAAEAAAKNGTAGMDKAQLYEAFAKRALDEGADKILTGIQSTAPTLDAVKKAGGSVAGVVGEDLADVFNKTGAHWKVGADTVVQHFVDKDPAGREFVNSRIVGKDGKPVVDNVATAGLMMQDYKTRLEARRADTSAYQAGQQIEQAGARDAETARSNKERERQQAIANDNTYRVGMAGVGVQQGRLKLEQQQYQEKTIDGQMAQITKALGPLSNDEEKAYRRKLLGLGQSKSNDDAFVNDVVKKWAENNPTASAAEVANYRSGLQTSLVQAGNNRAVEGEVHAQFAKNPFGSPGYDQVYGDAKKQLGMTDQQLAAMGYKAPVSAPRIAARSGTAAPRMSYAESQAAEAEAKNAARIAELSKNVAGLQELDAQGKLNPYAKESLAEQAAELARLQAPPPAPTQAVRSLPAPSMPSRAPDPRQVADLQARIADLQAAQKAGRLLDPARLRDLQGQLARMTGQ